MSSPPSDERVTVESDEGLTKTYNVLEDASSAQSDVVWLRELHEATDRDVLDVYGWTDVAVPPFCPMTLEEQATLAAFEDEVVDRLYVLNTERRARRAMKLAFLALPFALAGANACGQTLPDVRPGDTVRVRAKSDAVLRLRPDASGAEARLITSRAFVVGRVVEADAQRLLVSVPAEDARLEIALGDVRLLQRSAGRKRSVLKSTLTGVAIGAAVGAVLGLTTDGGCVGERGEGATLTCIGLGAAVVAPVGALIGALVAPEREQWRDVPLQSGPILAIRLSWSF